MNELNSTSSPVALMNEIHRLQALIINDEGTGWKQKADNYKKMYEQWARYASYCRSCARSGEHDPIEFEAFVKRMSASHPAA